MFGARTYSDYNEVQNLIRLNVGVASKQIDFILGEMMVFKLPNCTETLLVIRYVRFSTNQFGPLQACVVTNLLLNDVSFKFSVPATP